MVERKRCKECGEEEFFAEIDDEVVEFVCSSCDAIYFPSEIKNLITSCKVERVQ